MLVQLIDNPDYFVDSEGRVYSCKPGHSFRELRGSRNLQGYRMILLYKDGNHQSWLLHRLIMSVFYGKSDLVVNHKNGIKTDNRLENLEYVTTSQNVRHAWATGLCDNVVKRATETGKLNARKKFGIGQTHARAKFSDQTIAEIRQMAAYMTKRQIAERMGTSPQYVGQIIANKTRQQFTEETNNAIV